MSHGAVFLPEEMVAQGVKGLPADSRIWGVNCSKLKIKRCIGPQGFGLAAVDESQAFSRSSSLLDDGDAVGAVSSLGE